MDAFKQLLHCSHSLWSAAIIFSRFWIFFKSVSLNCSLVILSLLYLSFDPLLPLFWPLCLSAYHSAVALAHSPVFGTLILLSPRSSFTIEKFDHQRACRSLPPCAGPLFLCAQISGHNANNVLNCIARPALWGERLLSQLIFITIPTQFESQ